MNNKILKLLLVIIIFAGSSCTSMLDAPTSPPVQILSTPFGLSPSSPISPTQTLDGSSGFAIPTATPIPTETLIPTATNGITVEPTYTPYDAAQPGSAMPVYPGAQNVSHEFFPSPTGAPRDSVYYRVAAQPADLKDFYMQELVNAGWIWTYTDEGTSLVITAPTPTLLMEFRKGTQKIGIAVAGFGPELIVFAAIDYSGYSLITGFIGGIAGGLDMIGASRDEAEVDMMQFSSSLLEFRHPSNWLVTDGLMQIFDSDNAVNYIPESGNCDHLMKLCFVNFSDLIGSHFDTPLSIRVHTGVQASTLEEADELRWEDLTTNIHNGRYAFPEDLIIAGSTKTIEIRPVTLGDGTPAIQRIYTWKHEDESDVIISTYTLFFNGDLLLEFHTDFTSDEWEFQEEIVDQVLEGIRIVQQ